MRLENTCVSSDFRFSLSTPINKLILLVPKKFSKWKIWRSGWLFIFILLFGNGTKLIQICTCTYWTLYYYTQPSDIIALLRHLQSFLCLWACNQVNKYTIFSRFVIFFRFVLFHFTSWNKENHFVCRFIVLFHSNGSLFILLFTVDMPRSITNPLLTPTCPVIERENVWIYDFEFTMSTLSTVENDKK